MWWVENVQHFWATLYFLVFMRDKLITHTHRFNGHFFGTTRVSQYQKGKTNLDFTEARDSEWQWHQLGHMQVCTLLQTDTTPAPHRSVFLQAGCPSCHPTNSVKALKAKNNIYSAEINQKSNQKRITPRSPHGQLMWKLSLHISHASCAG